MATTTLILANRFNNLQSRIANVNGNPSSLTDTTGYGMPIRSSAVQAKVLQNKNFNAATAINYSTNTFTISGHGLQDGDIVEYDTQGLTPAVGGVIDGGHYYVDRTGSNTFRLRPASNSGVVDIIDTNPSGTHRFRHLDGFIVSADDFFNLYLDIASARLHQSPSTFEIENSRLLSVGSSLVEETYISSLETIMTSVEADALVTRSNFNLTDLTDGSATPITQQRVRQWNGVIRHEFNINFPGTQGMRAFFNAGGQIRLSQNITGGSGLKTSDWKTILSEIGNIIISRGGVSVSGSASVTSRTPFSVSTSYQQIVRKDGASYADNSIRIFMRRTSNTQLRFRIDFRDDDNPPSQAPFFDIDENVNGTLRSIVQYLRPQTTFNLGGVSYTAVDKPITGQVLQTIA